MDPVRNPFAPGAGSRPPELAGRQLIIEDARVAIERALLGKSSRSQMFLGLRGVGKTVLLNTVETMARERGHLTSIIEAPESKPLGEQLLPRVHQVLRKLSLTDQAKAKAHEAMRALRSFAAVFKFEYGDIAIAVDPEVGVADSGDLENDLPELFVRIGEAAKAAGKAWTLLIDEVQYLNQKDLAALIVSLYKINQANLPVLFFGAGLPQVAALSGEAKSYAERLFHYPDVGALPEADAKAAIRQPVNDEGASIDDDALAEIFQKTCGYPYFLQEWGHQSWNLAPEWFDGLKRAAEGRRLMVLDTLRRFHIEEENASGPMAQVIGRMEAIAADTGCSIVFLHHASKGAAMMGAGDQQQASLCTVRRKSPKYCSVPNGNTSGRRIGSTS